MSDQAVGMICYTAFWIAMLAFCYLMARDL